MIRRIMISIRSLVFLFVVGATSLSRADIYTANSIDEINNTLLELLEKRNAQKTLTILPLEGFLLKPVDAGFYAKDRKFSAIMSKISKKVKLSKHLDYILKI